MKLICDKGVTGNGTITTTGDSLVGLTYVSRLTIIKKSFLSFCCCFVVKCQLHSDVNCSVMFYYNTVLQEFELTTCHVCPGGCDAGGGSGGSIVGIAGIVIILL